MIRAARLRRITSYNVCYTKLLREAQGLLEKIEEHGNAVGECYRCKTVIEPYLSKQWYVNVGPLAEKAIEAVKDGHTRIVPEQWEKTYFEWMYNIRDWCISRQIWWGHRIPAWYCDDCEGITVAREDVEVCAHCGSKALRQETDVLDTWFSSALWPFSTMGWPEKTGTLKKFYPTSCLVTGFDILFFWVARMMMMGLKFMGDVPVITSYSIHYTKLYEAASGWSRGISNCLRYSVGFIPCAVLRCRARVFISLPQIMP